MDKEKLYRDAAEYGALHNEDCLVNSEYGTDGSTPVLGCCENMKMVSAVLDEAVKTLTVFFSHDIFDNEEQRKAGVEMYLEDYASKKV